MYVYYIRDDTTRMYMIQRMKLGAPVPTCVWGERLADAMTFENAAQARKTGATIRLRPGGGNERPTSGRAEGERTGCAARNPWPVADEDRGRDR